MEISLLSMSFDEVCQNSDVILSGICSGVTPFSPVSGYTKYTFSNLKVYCGLFQDETLAFSIPRARIPNYGSIGTDEFIIGKEYLLPLIQDSSPFGTTYRIAAFGMSLNLTDNDYRLLEEIVQAEGSESLIDHAKKAYDSVSHDKELFVDPTVEFQGFLNQSDYICRLRILEATEGLDRTVVRAECKEVLQGDQESLDSLWGDGTLSVAVIKDSVKVGEEYVIGFVGSGAYTVSGKHAVYLPEEWIRLLNQTE